jgi:hypothetical protein
VVIYVFWVNGYRHFEVGTGQLKSDGTHEESKFRLSAKRTSPFKSAGESVQSTTGNRVVRIRSSNAWYTMFRDSVKGTGYPLHSPVSSSLPSCASPCAITFQLDSTSVFIYRFRHSTKISWRTVEVFLTLKMTALQSVETSVNLNNRHGLTFHET